LNVFDDQKPFCKKVSGLPKTFDFKPNKKFWEVSEPFFKRVLTRRRQD
jgi:hypothetical protein